MGNKQEFKKEEKKKPAAKVVAKPSAPVAAKPAAPVAGKPAAKFDPKAQKKR